MVNTSATNFTTEINVLDPNNLDGTAFFTANSNGAYVNGNLLESDTASAAVTAHAGGGQTNATPLTSDYNLITVCASNYDSVQLQTVFAGARQTVKNTGAAILSVFPATGNAINALAVNLSIDIPVGGEITFRGINATTWETNTALTLPAPATQKGNLVLKAANNAGNTQTLITNASFAQASTLTIPDPKAAAASFLLTAATIGTDGLTVIRLPLTHGRNANGTTLVATSPGTTDYTVSCTPGTSLTLAGHAAQGNTKTDNVIFEIALPPYFIAATNITFTVNANYSGSGTAGTKTVGATCYLEAVNGTQGANLIATAAQTITTSAADYAFTVTGTTLNPGDKLLFEVTTVLQETGGTSSLTAAVNSVRLS